MARDVPRAAAAREIVHGRVLELLRAKWAGGDKQASDADFEANCWGNEMSPEFQKIYKKLKIV